MKKPIVITEVTRMQEGRVCIAGYDQNGQCIRLFYPRPAFTKARCTLNTGYRFPICESRVGFTHPTPQPPHTEDVRYDPTSIRFIERQPVERWHRMLHTTVFQSVSAIFEQPILTDPGHYIMDGKVRVHWARSGRSRLRKSSLNCRRETNVSTGSASVMRIMMPIG